LPLKVEVWGGSTILKKLGIRKTSKSAETFQLRRGRGGEVRVTKKRVQREPARSKRDVFPSDQKTSKAGDARWRVEGKPWGNTPWTCKRKTRVPNTKDSDGGSHGAWAGGEEERGMGIELGGVSWGWRRFFDKECEIMEK